MPLFTNSSTCFTATTTAVNSSDRNSTFPSNSRKATTPRILHLPQNQNFNVSGLAVKDKTVLNALVRDTVGPKEDVTSSSSILAYDLIQGALVRWSSVMDRSLPDPPTAVFLHGILGCRKNWDLRCHGDSASMKKRGPHTVASAALDVLKLVRDLRITPRVLVGHSFGGKVVLSMVDQAAKPLARPVKKCRQVDPKDSRKECRKRTKGRQIQARQQKNAVNRGPKFRRSIQLQGKMHTCGAGADIRGYATWGVEQPLAAAEHAVEELFSVATKITDVTASIAPHFRMSLDSGCNPRKSSSRWRWRGPPSRTHILIKYTAKGVVGFDLKSCYDKKVSSKKDVVKALIQQGFSNDVAQWVVTNLRPTSAPNSRFSWVFDLKGISEMYQSYEETNLWKIVEDVPRGVHINFLKAERSLHRWALEDLQRIHVAEEVASEEGGGVEMHVLEDAGHWVHTDNPDGLFRILSSSFRGNSRT
ncbi:hypothetical protein TSUD_229690 [Trifolium subterraneum]|uniref:AB hydrolase-1 domain-containing protein n=2 Tax=Trifolium TaxID=3898 RepID=A0A2Z6MHZ9_TRISU|nr:hypothetical protein TSUD_229690 [Trifolium subterraneum]